jgi:hypothetical protein
MPRWLDVPLAVTSAVALFIPPARPGKDVTIEDYH